MLRQHDVWQTGARSTRLRGYFAAKRGLDLILGFVILLLSLPAMLLIGLLIKLDSHGPIFFVQTRLGLNGRPFPMYKFRTMHFNASPELHQQYMQAFIRNEVKLEDSETDSETIYKLTSDPRITRVGRVLRRTSLDELPQTLNVLKGEMSLVGPRPPLPYEVEDYEDWHLGRLAAIPGITGLWQVRGRSRVPFDEMVRMDLQYIAEQSLWLDLKILLLTSLATVKGEGAR